MLKHLKLENFRNHHHFELNLGKITAIIGPNGAGKSNILEAIAMLSFCRSFREEDKKNLINCDKDYARVIGDDLEIFLQKTPRFLMKPKAKQIFKRQADFIGTLKAVVFSPESVEIILGSPSARRRFLDIMISQRNRDYLLALIAYDKIKIERNSLLQMISEGRGHEDELLFWDDELVKYGGLIIDHRGKIIKEISQEADRLYNEISGNKSDRMEIKYHSNAQENFSSLLKQNRRREIVLGRTMIGPHRDDLEFLLNGSTLANFGSRGEVRTAVLALKIAELNFLEHQEEDKGKALLLLDDVFSEFDQSRRFSLAKLITQHQTVMTTTDIDHLAPEIKDNAKIIELSSKN